MEDYKETVCKVCTGETVTAEGTCRNCGAQESEVVEEKKSAKKTK